MEMRASLLLAAAILPAAATAAEYQLMWRQTYDSSAHSHDVAMDAAGTPGGETVAIGYERRNDLAEGYNILIQKFDGSGGRLWQESYNSGDDSNDRGNAVSVGSDGSIVGAGYSADGTTVTAGWVRKYSSDGTPQWTATFNRSGTAETVFEGVAVDESTGDIYLAGACRPGTQYWDGLLVKYSAAGALIWSFTYDGKAGGDDQFLDVAVDGAGNVLVTGYHSVAKNPFYATYNEDIYVGKYGPAGNLDWNKSYGSETGVDFYRDLGYAIAVDEADDVYVAGTLVSTVADSMRTSRWIRKYRSSGNSVLWTALYQREPLLGDCALDIVLGGDGAAYVSGWAKANEIYKGKNIAVDRLNCQSGALLQMFDYHADRGTLNTTATDEIGYGIAAWSDSRFVVVGSEDRADIGQGLNWTLLSCSFPPVPPPSRENIRAYPNPFRPDRAVGGTMKFANLPPGSGVKIYTLAGRLVRELEETGNSAAWDGCDETGREMATGVYYYLVAIPGQLDARGKFALIRK